MISCLFILGEIMTTLRSIARSTPMISFSFNTHRIACPRSRLFHSTVSSSNPQTHKKFLYTNNLKGGDSMQKANKVGLFLLIAGSLLTSVALCADASPQKAQDWQIGPFMRIDKDNPIIKPNGGSTFFCPVQNKVVHWECDHTFNPAAVVRDGKVYVLYRAEDNFGQGIGRHTSRIGLAESDDGIHFTRGAAPVLYPDNDAHSSSEWSGGCEDPRIVQREDGTYIMTYTQWSGNNDDTPEPHIPLLGVATSKDLRFWEKHGYAFAHSEIGPFHSKSGSIVCKRAGDNLIATKVEGKYWMYWGEGPVFAATSDDLIKWEPIVDDKGNPLPALDKRAGKFDSALVEAGPPALLTDKGILLLYNGKNAEVNGDPSISVGAYAAGQVLFNASNPTQVIERTEESFFKPEREYEKAGQYENGTVFIEGLIPFRDKWLLYYGTADSAVGVAVCDKIELAK